MRPWRCMLTMGSICLFTLAAAAQNGPVEARAAGLGLAKGDADAFVYIRQSAAGTTGLSPGPGINQNRTLMLTRLTATGISTKELFTGNVSVPLCAAAGKIYFYNGGEINVLDLAAARVDKIDSTFSAHVVHDGFLYYTTPTSQQHLRVLDPASQSFMNLVTSTPDQLANVMRLVFSPHATHLAWIALPNTGGARSFISGWRIGVFDLVARTNKILEPRLSYTPPVIRTLGSSPNLIAWRDDRTRLTITNDPPAAPGARPAADYLTAIDIETGRQSRLCVLPVPDGGVEFIPPTPISDLAILVNPSIDALGHWPANSRLSFDTTTNAVHAARTRFGRFELEGGGLRNTPVIYLDGQCIGDASQSYTISPDGNRMLHVTPTVTQGGLAHVISLYDAPSKTDRVIGSGSSVLWLNSRDLETPAAPPEPPPGFGPIIETPPPPQPAPAKTPVRIGIR